MILTEKYYTYPKKNGWIKEENGKIYLLPGGPREIQILTLTKNSNESTKNTKNSKAESQDLQDLS